MQSVPRGQKVYCEPGPPSSHSPSPPRIQRDGSVSPQVLSHVDSAVCAQICAQEARSRARERAFIAVRGGAGLCVNKPEKKMHLAAELRLVNFDGLAPVVLRLLLQLLAAQ